MWGYRSAHREKPAQQLRVLKKKTFKKPLIDVLITKINRHLPAMIISDRSISGLESCNRL